MSQACGAKCKGNAKSVARANTLLRGGSESVPRRGSNPGIRSPGDLSPRQMPTRPSRANSCRGLQNSRKCRARWVLLSAARPSPRPCTPCCGPAPAPAALPRPRPTLLPGGRLQAPHAHRAASRGPAIASAHIAPASDRSPSSTGWPSRSAARQFRARMRAGRHVATRHATPLTMASTLYQPAAMSMSMSSMHR